MPNAMSTSAKGSIDRLRLLDFDDLLLLRHLQSGLTIAATARELGLTQPAVTQRLRKIERVFDDAMIEKIGRHVRLTQVGKSVCERAAQALSLMQESPESASDQQLTLAIEYEHIPPGLWQAILGIRQSSHEGAVINIVQCAGNELARILEAGRVDVVMTTVNLHTVKDIVALEVIEDPRVLVASPEVVSSIKNIADLRTKTLIDIDRSLPHAGGAQAADQSPLKFRSLWVLGTIELVQRALIAGEGVGVLPLSSVKRYLEGGQLARIDLAVDVGVDEYRAFVRKGHQADKNLNDLISRLQLNFGR